MAKQVKVSIIVDDDGTMRLTEKSAKKLGAGLDQVGRSAVTADRQLKGVAQASANGAKNFSKQAQGISNGIVPVYAALAAQIFALGAAFRFLQRAGDLASLREGQVAYASATGVALRSLTNRIIEATNAQITFQDAAQAAAIGTASGLSPEQLTKLGSAAKDVSIILGRDVTDSFNRLVRGVTKAEPELLDELGIVLRLKDATEAYAQELGKNANELTAFERSQAVANDVLAQTEEKYARIIEITNPSINSFNKFGKAFDDIVNTISGGLVKLLAPLAEIAAANPFATLLAAAPVLGGLINQIAPSVTSFFDGIGSGLDKMTKGLDNVNTALQVDLTQLGALKGDLGAANELSKISSDRILTLGRQTNISAYGFKKLAAGGKLSLKTIELNIKNASQGLYEYAGVSEAVRQEFVNNFRDMRTAVIAMQGETVTSAKVMETQWRVAITKMKMSTVKFASGVASLFASLVKGIVRNLLRVVSVVGIASIAFDLLPDRIKKAIKEGLGFRVISDDVKKVREEVSSLSEELKNFAEVQKELGTSIDKVYIRSLDRIIAVGKASAQLSLSQVTLSLADYNAEVENAKTNTSFLASVFQNVLNPEAGHMTAGMLILKKSLEAYAWATDQTAEKVVENMVFDEAAKSALGFYEQIRKSISVTELSSDAAKAYGLALDSVISSMNANLEVTEEQEKALKRTKARFEEVAAGAEAFATRVKQAMTDLDALFLQQSQRTPFERMAQELMDIEKVIFEIQGNSLKLTENGIEFLREMSIEERNRLKDNLKSADIVKKLSKTQQDIQLKQLVLQNNYAKAQFGLTKNESRRLGVFKKVVDLEFQLADKEAVMEATIKRELALKGRIDEIAQQNIVRQQLAIEGLKEEIKQLEIAENLMFKMGTAFNQGLEASLGSAIEDFILAKESSIKDSLLKVMQGVAESVGKTISQYFTESILGIIPGFESAEDRKNRLTEEALERGGKKAAEHMQAAIEAAAAPLESTSEVFAAQAKLIDTVDKNLNNNFMISLSDSFTDGASHLKKAIVDGATEAASILNQKVSSVLPSQTLTTSAEADKKLLENDPLSDPDWFKNLKRVGGIGAEAEAKGAIDSIDIATGKPNYITTPNQYTPLKQDTDPLQLQEVLSEAVKEGIIKATPGTVGMFTQEAEVKALKADPEHIRTAEDKLNPKNVLSKDSSLLPAGEEKQFREKGFSKIFSDFGGKLKEIFSGASPFLSKLGSIFKGALSGFGGLFKDLFTKLLSGLGGGGGSFLGSLFGGLFGAAAGGIMPGGIKGYANGGIVKRPTLGLVGEGKMNEAVVPLPDGKAIPVNMNGNNSTNNVTVNVAMDGSGNGQSQSQSNGQQGNMLGKLIAGAVQEELQRQKRPGGILSPYGAA